MLGQDASYQIVAQRHHCQQSEIEAAGLIIEIVREGCHKQQAHRQLALQQHINKGEPQKQYQKQARGEKHGLVSMICQEMKDAFCHGCKRL